MKGSVERTTFWRYLRRKLQEIEPRSQAKIGTWTVERHSDANDDYRVKGIGLAWDLGQVEDFLFERWEENTFQRPKTDLSHLLAKGVSQVGQ